nr:hypothetical protein [Tanacetum cinerariifolium]
MSPRNVAGDKSGSKSRYELSPQSGRAESVADRVHSRAVAAAVVAAVVAETQPKVWIWQKSQGKDQNRTKRTRE